MAKKRLYAHIILDASGSMAPTKTATLKAFNDYIDGLAAEPEISTRVSFTTFNQGTGAVLVRDTVKVKQFARLTDADYWPDNGTPLYDAIGDTVALIDAQTRREGENVALVILTDGYENASSRFDKEKIAKLLDDRQKEKNWLVIYLGANQDAMAEGAKMGTAAVNTMTFDVASMGNVVGESTLRATRAYASTGMASAASYTADERFQAMGGKPSQPLKQAPKAKPVNPRALRQPTP